MNFFRNRNTLGNIPTLIKEEGGAAPILGEQQTAQDPDENTYLKYVQYGNLYVLNGFYGGGLARLGVASETETKARVCTLLGITASSWIESTHYTSSGKMQYYPDPGAWSQITSSSVPTIFAVLAA